jgi:HK97 family phage prohead protease
MVVHLKSFVSDPATGKDAIVRGYAAIFGVPSTATFEDGLPEIITRGAFDKYLSAGRTPALVFNHQAGGLMAAADYMCVWSDDVGLAFEASNIRMTDENDRVVQMIAKGLIPGCSWRPVFAKGGRNVELVDDRQSPEFVPMWVIREAGVTELGPVLAPAYGETGCWLSSADPDRLDSRCGRLARQWQKSAGR